MCRLKGQVADPSTLEDENEFISPEHDKFYPFDTQHSGANEKVMEFEF